MELHKELIVWGDFVLHKEPQILGLLDKRIIVMDWNYAENNAVPLHDTLRRDRRARRSGHRSPRALLLPLGRRASAPSNCAMSTPMPTRIWRRTPNPASLGVMVTNWIPSRYIQNSIWDSFAYAAVALNQGTATAQASGFRRFVEKHYQTAWNEQWREVFESLYSTAPCWPGGATASWHGLTLPVPWSSDAQLTAVLRAGAPPPNPFTRLSSLLVMLEPSVLTNLSDFQAFALCIRVSGENVLA